MKASLVITLAIASLACRDKGKADSKQARPASQVQKEDKPFDMDDVASCQPCHAAVVGEYLTSMHGRSDERYDPIYSAVREARLQRGGMTANQECETCHSPRRLIRGDSKVAGLGCATCHGIQSVKDGAHGTAALVATEGNLLLGPSDVAPGVAPHATGPAPAHMKNSDALCLACHGEMHGADGKPLCRSGPVYARAEGAPAEGAPAEGAPAEGAPAEAEAPETCVGCHMPQVSGPSGSVKPQQRKHASHIFNGPHDGWYRDNVKISNRAIDLYIAWHGDTLDVSISNETGHTYPGGFHGRVAVLEVIGFNREGAPIWRGEPQAPTPGVEGEALGLVYTDAQGKATLPPYAAGPPRDTRLAPWELRKYSFQPPAQVVHGRVILTYRLINPGLAESLGMGHLLETQEKFVAKADALR